MKDKSASLLKAAVAGLVGAAAAASALAADKADNKEKPRMAEVVKCYGVNSCSGKGQGAPKNACAGQGWLWMPAESCVNVTGGSLKPIERPKPAPTQAPPAKTPTSY